MKYPSPQCMIIIIDYNQARGSVHAKRIKLFLSRYASSFQQVQKVNGTLRCNAIETPVLEIWRVINVNRREREYFSQFIFVRIPRIMFS